MKHRRARRVVTIMKTYALAIVIAACGPKQPTQTVSNAGSADSNGPVRDTRSEIERRRDAACDTLGPRITKCAVEDAKKELAAGKTTKQQFEQNTAQGVLDKNTAEFIKQCRGAQYSSRQVRVLEVCQQQETECEPMLSCLENLNKK